MKKYCKNIISFCLSMTVAAASMPMAAGMGEIPDRRGAQPSARAVKPVNAAAVSADDNVDELEQFAVLTLKKGGDSFTADGRDAGRSVCGFDIGDDSRITVNIGGKRMTLEQAKAEIGCEVTYNSDGDICIRSPFHRAAVVVSSDVPFDTFGAVEAEEKAEGIFLLKYDSPADAYSAYKRLIQNDSINFAEADEICCEAGSDGGFGDALPEEYSGIIDNWGVSAIGADEFCKRLREEKDELPEVTVAVLDTGVFTEHRFFEGRIREGGKCFVEGYDESTYDADGHGSHCAGIICNATNDNVKILPVKVLDDRGSGDNMGVYCGIMYAVEQGVDVISMSLGSFGYSNLIREAFAAAEAAGITVVVAAGNDGRDSSDMYPTYTSVDNTIVIAAVDETEKTADFSTYGKYVDFAAPGVGINSVGVDSDTAEIVLDGTSMAAPHAAACFADVISYDYGLSPRQQYNIIKANAADKGEEGWDEHYGWGIVDLGDFRFTEEYILPPHISPEGGSFADKAEVTISCSDEKSEIYYTVDGSAPNKENGIKYEGGTIELTSTSLLRATAYVGDSRSCEVSEYFTVNGKVDERAFDIKKGVLRKCLSDVEFIDLKALSENGRIPEVTAVASDAFAGNKTLKEIILPDSVTEIGERAFEECTSLERVVCKNAARVKDYAFSGDTALREFICDELREVGWYTFYSCKNLETFDGSRLTELPVYSFYGCSRLDADNFDLRSICYFDDHCLMGSGLSGVLDLRDSEYFGALGEYAFAETKLTEVRLSEATGTLSCGLFDGCRQLKKISAPGIREIHQRALALDKDGFTEENKVAADIDFSKVTYVGQEAFYGYVFDKPVSFDKLYDDTFLNNFAGAYGEELSLPTLEKLRVETDGAGGAVSTDMKVSLIRAEYAVNAVNTDKLSCYGIYSRNPLLFNEKNLPKRGTIISDSINSRLAEICSERGIAYTTFPCAVTGSREEFVYKGEKGYVKAFVLGDGLTSKLCRVGDDGRDVLVREDPDTYTEIDTSVCGVQKYVFKAFNKDGSPKAVIPIEVNVIEPQTIDITAKDVEYINFADAIADGNGEKRVNVRMIPETSEQYTVSKGEFYAEVYKDGEYVTSFKEYIPSAAIDLEAGCEYVFALSGNINNYFFNEECVSSPMSMYFAVRPTADNSRHIGFSTTIRATMADFTGTEKKYKPHLYIYDYEDRYVLVEGVDYEYCMNNEPQFGENSVTIKGIGRYFGIIRDKYCYAYPHVREDEPMPLVYDFEDDNAGTFQECVFIPEEDGLYTITAMPTDKQIASAVEGGELMGEEEFMPDIDVSKIISLAPYETKMLGTGDFSYTKGFNSISIEMRAGEIYEIYGLFTDKNLVVTRKKSIGECSVEMAPSYPFSGEPVEPEFKVTDASGKVLVKDVDFRAKFWNNDKPGIAFGIIEGIGNYAGCSYTAAAIEGANLTSEYFMDSRVMSFVPNTDIPAKKNIRYKLTLDRDMEIEPVVKSGAEDVCVYVYTLDGVLLYTFVPDNGTCILSKGEYFVVFDEIESDDTVISLTSTDNISINDADIIVSPFICTGNTTAPSVSVGYGGKALDPKNYEIFMPENVTAGINALSVCGYERFFGAAVLPYIYIPQEGVMKLGEGSNEITVDEWESFFCEWTPETDINMLSCDSGRFVTVSVYDEELELVSDSVINRRLFSTVELEAGKTYYVEIYGEIGETFNLNITSQGILSECGIEYDPSYLLGSDAPIHDVIFTDGEYTLIEGVDYIVTGGCPVDEIGGNEFIYKGIGKYSGEVTLTFIAYTETMPEETYATITRGYDAVMGATYYLGTKRYFRFTSDSDKPAEYRASVRLNKERYAENASLIAYDETGGFIGTFVNEFVFTLEPGESVYMVAVDTYILDMYERNETDSTVFNVELVGVKDEPEPPEVTEPSDPQPVTGSLGDVNGDGFVNANDASRVLVEYSILSTGGEPAFGEQEQWAADVNRDGRIDAVDASRILVFYSYLSTGGTVTDMSEWEG